MRVRCIDTAFSLAWAHLLRVNEGDVHVAASEIADKRPRALQRVLALAASICAQSVGRSPVLLLVSWAYIGCHSASTTILSASRLFLWPAT